MSGTSMDGLDLSFTEYTLNQQVWNYKIIHCKTYNYPAEILSALKESVNYSARDLCLLDKTIGQHFSTIINQFISENAINKNEVTCIASHGHTIFHEPDKGYTLQIGCGQTIASLTGIDTINDFRQRDVIHGGQGAPLVPIGDKLLFNSSADAFLNLGGFANICIPSPTVKAYDICPANLPLNRICEELDLTYDDKGELARRSKVNLEIVEQLDQLDFYQQFGPKSLGTEWLNDQFMPIINKESDAQSRIATIIEHISSQISAALNNSGIKSVLVTGGGAYNDFLIERISSKTKVKIKIPERNIIDFKEALVFGFLGALYLRNQPNCLSSVTGAKKDVVGGVLHHP